jgi:hypothetical protein
MTGLTTVFWDSAKQAVWCWMSKGDCVHGEGLTIELEHAVHWLPSLA